VSIFLNKRKLVKSEKIIIGIDTRESGNWIFEALCLGFNKSNFSVDFAGIIPTPVLSFLTKKGDYDCGVMISASHNPYVDNGIKFFSRLGEKFVDQFEIEIEKEILNLDLNKNNFLKNRKKNCYENISRNSYELYLS
jgi:phosphoglucosamine mutase